MASTTTSAHLPALGTHERNTVGRELQATLVELVDLSLIGKQLHWSVVGPLFRPLHEQLDELVASWRTLADKVAERAVAIGIWPDGQASAVMGESDLLSIERGAVADHDVVLDITRCLGDVCEHTRERMDRVENLDGASHDVLVQVVREIEQQWWMIRAQLLPEG